MSVLDHLLALLARYASFDLALEVAPGSPEQEVRAAGRAFGESLRSPLREAGIRGHGSAVVPSAGAPPALLLQAGDQAPLVSNGGVSAARVGGVATDLVDVFLRELVEGASLTLHVRLIDGSDTHHVLEAIFKALGVALAQACRPRRRKEKPRLSTSQPPSPAPPPQPLHAPPNLHAI